MASKLSTIIKKNLQIITNSKLSFMIFVFGPILLMLIIGIGLGSTSIRNIEAGVYVNKSVTDFPSLLQGKLGLSGIKLTIYDSITICKNQVLSGEKHVCIEINEYESEYQIKSVEVLRTEKDYFYDVDLHLDFSKQRTVWGIIHSVNVAIEEVSEEIKKRKIEALNSNIDLLIGEISENERKINEVEDAIDSVERGLEAIENNQLEVIRSLEEARASLGALHSQISSLPIDTQDRVSILSRISELQNSMDFLIRSIERSGFDREKDRINEAQREIGKIKRSITLVKQDLTTLKGIDFDKILNPINIRTASIGEEDIQAREVSLEFLDYLFPTFLIMFIILVGIILPAVFTIKERKSPAFVRNITSNATGRTLVFSNFLTYSGLILIQALVLSIVGIALLNINLIGNLFALIMINIILITTLTLLGMCLGHIFNSQESAAAASIVFALIFIIFTSLITPIETLQPAIAGLIKILPTTILENSLRESLIFNLPFSLSLVESLMLVLSYAILIIILVFSYKKAKEKEI